jgi:hypothetical protein
MYFTVLYSYTGVRNQLDNCKNSFRWDTILLLETKRTYCVQSENAQASVVCRYLVARDYAK